MIAFQEWLETNLGLSPAVLELGLLPLLAAAVTWAVFSLAVSLIGRHVRDASRRAKLRTLAVYGAIALGAVLFSSIWLAGVRRLASLLEAKSPAEIESLQAYLDGCLYAVLATGAMVLAVRFVRRAEQVVSQRVGRWAAHGDAIRLRGLELISRERAAQSAVVLARSVRTVTLLFLAYVYIPLVMSFFPATAPYGAQLFQYVAGPAARVLAAVVGYLPNLLYLVVVLVVVRYSLKLLRFLLDALGSGALVLGWFEPEWAQPTYKLIRALVAVFTLMIVFPYLPGAGSEFFQGFSLFVGALVTIGSSVAIGNLVSGVILTYTGSFRIGDRVRIGEAVGDVVAKTLFVTRLRTVQNEEVTVPNGKVLGGEVVNYSKAAAKGELGLVIQVGLGYDVHWARIETLLKKAASITPGIVPSPPSVVWPASLGDFAVVYELRVFTDKAAQMASISAALRRNVLDVIHGAGVEIMTPAVEAHRRGDMAAIPPESGAPPGEIV